MKTKKRVFSLIEKEEYQLIHELIPVLKKENEHVLNGIDEAFALLIEKKQHQKISNFFLYLMNSKSPTLLKLYYDSLLFNYSLYQLLKEQQLYESEHHFDYYLMLQAEAIEDNETKTYALSVLSMLKDSFYIKENLENQKK